MKMNLTDAQRYTLDRIVRAGWKPVHQDADGTLVVQRRTHQPGSSGLGVSLPGPFWTRVGGSSGSWKTEIAEVMVDGTVPVIEEQIADRKNALMITGMILGPLLVLTPIFPIALITMPFGAWLTWVTWRRFLPKWQTRSNGFNVRTIDTLRKKMESASSPEETAKFEKKIARIERSIR